jgi:probable phosphoglycerate mutase
MRLYIIRHADPDYDNNTITPAGHLEARALAPRLAAERLDYIYSSPLGRAVHTAEYTASLTGLTLRVEEWTREMDGLWIDLPPWGRMVGWDLPAETVRPAPPYPTHETWYRLAPFDEPRFRESFDQLRAASDDFLKRHGYERDQGTYRCVRSNRDRIAVFCHDGFARAWLAHLLEIPLSLMWASFWLPPSSVTTVLFEERSVERAAPRCIGLGDVSHLYAAGLPVRPRGIKGNFD